MPIKGGEALNYVTMSIFVLFSHISGSIVAMSLSLASDHMRHISPQAEVSSLVRGSGQSWEQWLYHETRTSMQASDIGAPKSVLAPSTSLEAEVLGQKQNPISHDEDCSHRERSALEELMEGGYPKSVDALLNHQDGRHSSLLDPSP